MRKTERRWAEQRKADGDITRIYDAGRSWSWCKERSDWLWPNELVRRVRVTLTYEVPDERP